MLTVLLLAGIQKNAKKACERGYLEMEASHMEDGNIYLSVLVDENLGDEDGFGVVPD